jgi:hypothetical protein
LPDVFLSGFSFTKGTNDGPVAKATALIVAMNDRTGALDTNFNDTGELINPNYGAALLTRVQSTHDGSNGETASDLYIVYGTAGTYASAIVDYPITEGVPDIAKPTMTQTVPSRFPVISPQCRETRLTLAGRSWSAATPVPTRRC